MQNEFKVKEAPSHTYEVPDESHEVTRQDYGTNDLVGPVVVGGRASSDCFRAFDSLQAGTKDTNAYGMPFGPTDGDADDKNIPSRPW